MFCFLKNGFNKAMGKVKLVNCCYRDWSNIRKFATRHCKADEKYRSNLHSKNIIDVENLISVLTVHSSTLQKGRMSFVKL